MAQRLSAYAGSGHVPLNRAYPYNTMNDLVYPVHSNPNPNPNPNP